MSKCSIAMNGSVETAPTSGNYAKHNQMRRKVSNYYSFSVAAQNRVNEGQHGPGFVDICIQGSGERPLSTAAMNVTSRSHQRRWSEDFCQSDMSRVITVRKNRKELTPPQRSVSLLRLQSLSHASFKRYSCPPNETFISQSSSSSSSCSSPPLVPTSIITGHDPLGWKLQPKSSSVPSQNHAKRLSLQIPLPEVPTLSSPNPESSTKTKPALRPKPSSRRHSEPTAFLRSLGTALPVMTPEELSAVHLQTITLSDDVFDETTPEQRPAPPCKVPPPVPVKTTTARQIAHLIASSRRCLQLVTAISNNRTTPSHQYDEDRASTITCEYRHRLHQREVPAPLPQLRSEGEDYRRLF